MTETTPETPPDDAPPPADDNPGREAARYRRQLREVEAERDALRERVTTYHRATVEQMAGERLTNGADVWLAGVEVDAVLTETGEIDADKVRDAIDGVLVARPHWQKPPAAPLYDGGVRASVPVEKGWADVLRGR